MAERTGIDRREFLKLSGAAGLGVVAGPMLWRQPAMAGAPAPEQLHVQFGADAARQAVVSWATPEGGARPRLRFGTANGGLGSEVRAVTRTYRDHATKREIHTHHAVLDGLDPSTEYRY